METDPNFYRTDQIRKVLHCLGLNVAGKSRVSHRNHYCAGGIVDEDWELMVRLGYAHRADKGSELGGIFYSVSPRGKQWVESFYGEFEEMG